VLVGLPEAVKAGSQMWKFGGLRVVADARIGQVQALFVGKPGNLRTPFVGVGGGYRLGASSGVYLRSCRCRACAVWVVRPSEHAPASSRVATAC
jgi:hypothetical protein